VDGSPSLPWCVCDVAAVRAVTWLVTLVGLGGGGLSESLILVPAAPLMMDSVEHLKAMGDPNDPIAAIFQQVLACVPCQRSSHACLCAFLSREGRRRRPVDACLWVVCPDCPLTAAGMG
jgi:hypothetical protein